MFVHETLAKIRVFLHFLIFKKKTVFFKKIAFYVPSALNFSKKGSKNVKNRKKRVFFLLDSPSPIFGNSEISHMDSIGNPKNWKILGMILCKKGRFLGSRCKKGVKKRPPNSIEKNALYSKF